MFDTLGIWFRVPQHRNWLLCARSGRPSKWRHVVRLHGHGSRSSHSDFGFNLL